MPTRFKHCRTPACVLGILASLALLLSAGLGSAQEPPPPQQPPTPPRPLSQEEAGRVDAAIKVLEGKVKFMKTEQGLDTTQAGRIENGVAALRRVFDKKDGDQAHGFFAAGGTPDGVGAATIGPGQELGENGNPVPADQKKRIGPQAQEENHIQLQLGLVAELGDCSPVFLQLIETLLHESIHLNQVLVGLPVDLKGETETPEKAAKLLDAKLLRLKNELQAYQDSRFLMDQLITLFKRMRDNLNAGHPADEGFSDAEKAWAAHWKNCPLAAIRQILLTAAGVERDRLDGVKGVINLLDDLRSEYEGKQGKNETDALLALKLDDQPSFKQYAGAGAQEQLALNFQDSHLIIDGPSGGRVLLDTGIPHPQDFLVLATRTGARKILVCGVTYLDHPQGIVRLFDMPEVTATTGGTTGSVTELPFGSSPVITLAESLPFFLRPTSLASLGGLAYVWDADASVMYAIMDRDGDGVPESMDLTRPAAQVPAGFPLEHLVSLQAWGDTLVLNWRIGTALDAGDPVVFQFFNKDQDGVFHDARPTTLGRLLHPR